VVPRRELVQRLPPGTILGQDHIVTDAVAAGYDAVYRAWPSSPTFHATWARHAVGGKVAPGFEHLSFNTIDELHRFVIELRLEPDDRLVDIAGGAGGPGLWVARESTAALVGVDLSAVGTQLARQRAIDRGVGRAAFMVGTATAIGLADACAAGAMSVDSLQYVPDKRTALHEVARVLSPRGRFVFTAFELEPDRVAGLPVLGDDPVADYSSLLEEVGFAVDTYEETPNWKDRLEGAYAAVVAAEDALRPEMGEPAVDALLLELILTLEVRPYRRRVFAVAELS
jgi:SAM-dependent methyltransferase